MRTLLTVEEAAKLLKCHKNTIYNRIKHGEFEIIPRSVKGEKILIIEESIYAGESKDLQQA